MIVRALVAKHRLYMVMIKKELSMTAVNLRQFIAEQCNDILQNAF